MKEKADSEGLKMVEKGEMLVQIGNRFYELKFFKKVRTGKGVLKMLKEYDVRLLVEKIY